jgi:acetyltransferase-like isoleucine patch superfamily enzyme
MRKIKAGQIFVFLILLLVILVLGIGTTGELLGSLPLGDFRSVVLIAAAFFFIYIYTFVLYRLFLYLAPLKDGEIAEESRQEFVFHVYLLFYLILFFPLIRSSFIPVPLMRLIYIVLGADLGDNTYSSGIILDPPLTRIGTNTIVGQNALLIAHVNEGKRLALYRVNIGSNVTIGANAVVMPGVNIDDNAVVGTGAVVTKGTHIRSGEVWGGVPARKIKHKISG